MEEGNQLKLKVKKLLCLFIGLSLIGLWNAKPGYAATLKWDLDSPYRNDQLHWNIAGDISGRNPNVLSELSWKGIESWPLAANLQIGLHPRLSLIIDGDFALLSRGRVQDSDYNGDNRTGEFSRSDNENGGDQLYDFAGAIVYRVLHTGQWNISGRLGYSRAIQNFRMIDGQQIVPVVSPIGGLDSTYQATWFGPWIGVVSLYQPGGRVNISGGIAYHWVDYLGKGDWNLRDDLAHPISFSHQADGTGLVLDLGVAIMLAGHWGLRFNMQTSDWNAGPGVDYAYLNNGSVACTRLNEVAWSNLIIAGRIEWR